MPPYRTKSLCLSIALSILPAASALAQTPAPALHTQFSLPLADKTTAQAVLLPTLNGQAFLVYATPTGRLGLWTMNPTHPAPPPDPQPPPQPQPPNVLPPLPDWIIPGATPRERTCKGKCRWR
jgi:hypothetical protein